MKDAISLVQEKFGHLPYMTEREARRLRDLIVQNDLRRCLELGFFHGKSSAFIAAILREMGGGHLVTIDLLSAEQRSPNISEILRALALEEFVTYFFEPRSYTWRLLKMLEEHPRRQFDFCYFDGGHFWDPTGFAFFLVDKLLRPGGWILFDDLNWTAKSAVKPGTAVPGWIAKYPREEQSVEQVRKVFDLLVREHASYTDFLIEGKWGFARKKPASGAGEA